LQSDAPGWPQNPKDREFHTALINWLRFHRVLLIGELVPEALRYLRNNPSCDARSAFDHVILDEYQDLNRAEQDLIQLLSGNRAIAIVGDVDQSIYRFRHANPDGIQDYNARYPATHDKVLNECQRCPKSVIAIANHLISHNHPGIPRLRLRPLPANAAGEIHLIQWDSVEDEATGLADYIRALVARGVSPGDILVLTPRDGCSGTRLGIGSAIGPLQYIAFIMKKLWKNPRRSARTLCYHYSSTRKTESPFVGGSATAVRPDGEMRISG